MVEDEGGEAGGTASRSGFVAPGGYATQNLGQSKSTTRPKRNWFLGLPLPSSLIVGLCFLLGHHGNRNEQRSL